MRAGEEKREKEVPPPSLRVPHLGTTGGGGAEQKGGVPHLGTTATELLKIRIIRLQAMAQQPPVTCREP